jgi:hypothetical protein
VTVRKERRSLGAILASALVVLVLAAAGCSRAPAATDVAPTPSNPGAGAPSTPAAGGAPATFHRSTADARTTRVFSLRDGITKMAAFRAASDYLTQTFTIDVTDSRAGFLMTPWQSSTMREGVPDVRYRTRVVVRFLGEEWKQFSVKVEANWKRDDEWDVGFDSKLLEDVSTELQKRIGKV